MSVLLSLLPRRWLQNALSLQWQRTLPRGERLRLNYWGATGNPAHHPFQWADNLPSAAVADDNGKCPSDPSPKHEAAKTRELPDSNFEIQSGRNVRMFSIEHLRTDNVFAKSLTVNQLVERLEGVKSSELSHRLATRLRSLDQPSANDGELTLEAIRVGHAWGLGAAWGVDPAADYLWAAAAMILEARGVQHPNELIAPPSA